MRIRVIKTLPAPSMDGFDVRGIRAEHVYDVDVPTAGYLIISGYAVRADEKKNPNARREGGLAMKPSAQSRVPRC